MDLWLVGKEGKGSQLVPEVWAVVESEGQASRSARGESAIRSLRPSQSPPWPWLRARIERESGLRLLGKPRAATWDAADERRLAPRAR